MDASPSKSSAKIPLTLRVIFAVGLITLAISTSFARDIKGLAYSSYVLIISGFLGSAYSDWKQGERAEARSKVMSLIFVLFVTLIANLINIY